MTFALDPFLYLALAAGLIGGRFLSLPARWLNAATVVTVLVLILLLGLSLGGTSVDQLLSAVPVALLALAVMLGVTMVVAAVFRPARSSVPIGPTSGASRPWLGLVFLADVIVGFLLGHVARIPTEVGLRFSLYALLVLVGWGLVLSAAGLRRLWVPLVAAISGAIAGGLLLGLFFTSFGVGFAATFGFGFYTLTGALVEARDGAALGFLAFLINFLRENLTMVLSPWIGPRVRGEGLTALGGATSMDTTLFFITRYGDPDAASLALTSGLILTVVATVALPLLLALPGR